MNACLKITYYEQQPVKEYFEKGAFKVFSKFVKTTKKAALTKDLHYFVELAKSGDVVQSIQLIIHGYIIKEFVTYKFMNKKIYC